LPPLHISGTFFSYAATDLFISLLTFNDHFTWFYRAKEKFFDIDNTYTANNNIGVALKSILLISEFGKCIKEYFFLIKILPV